jgi:hypothetical protein
MTMSEEIGLVHLVTLVLELEKSFVNSGSAIWNQLFVIPELWFRHP